MKQAEILSSLVLFGASCFDWPQVARACVFPRETFQSSELVEIVRAIVLNRGNWRAALDDLRGSGRVPKCRLDAFSAWANKITKRKPPLLLPAPTP